MRLGEPAVQANASGVEIPFSLVHNLVVVQGSVNGTPVHLILDSGAPSTILDTDAAREAGVALMAGGASRQGGLDGGAVESRETMIQNLEIGSRVVRDLRCRV